MRQGIRLDVFGTRTVGQEKNVIYKKKAAGLPGIDLFGGPDVLQILKVCPNQERMLRSRQPVVPLLQGHLDNQQFPVPHILIGSSLAGVSRKGRHRGLLSTLDH